MRKILIAGFIALLSFGMCGIAAAAVNTLTIKWQFTKQPPQKTLGAIKYAVKNSSGGFFGGQLFTKVGQQVVWSNSKGKLAEFNILKISNGPIGLVVTQQAMQDFNTGKNVVVTITGNPNGDNFDLQFSENVTP